MLSSVSLVLLTLTVTANAVVSDQDNNSSCLLTVQLIDWKKHEGEFKNVLPVHGLYEFTKIVVVSTDCDAVQSMPRPLYEAIKHVDGNLKVFVDEEMGLVNAMRSGYDSDEWPEFNSVIDGAGGSEQCLFQNLKDSSADLWHIARTNSDRDDYEQELYAYNEIGEFKALVYVMDSGVRKSHVEFTDEDGNSRVDADFVAPNLQSYENTTEDLSGHGTHVIGLINGQTFGILKDVRVKSVKCLDRFNSGYPEDIVAGLEYIFKEVSERDEKSTSMQPVVVNMSFGTSTRNDAIYAAIKELFDMKVTLVTSAGNRNDAACFYYPAKYDEVITVTSVDKSNEMSDFSNFGPCVNFLAPGTDIHSAGTDSDNDTNVGSGTSYSAPLVSAVVARMLVQKEFNNFGELKDALEFASTTDVISLPPPVHTTPDFLIFINCTDLTPEGTTAPPTPPPTTFSPWAIALMSVASATVLTLAIIAILTFTGRLKLRSKKVTSDMDVKAPATQVPTLQAPYKAALE